MSDIKKLLTLLILINIQCLIKAQSDPIEIPLNYEETEFQDLYQDKYFVIKYKDDDLKDINYLTFTSKVENDIYSPGFIYISLTEKFPRVDKKDYFSQVLGKNEVIINVSKLKGKSNLYINLHPLKQGRVKFEVTTSKTLELSKVAKFKISDVDKIYFRPAEDEIANTFMLYSAGERIEYFSMKVIYKYDSGGQKEYKAEQKFDNGYGVIIDDLDITKTGIFEISVLPNENYPGINSKEKMVEVGLDLIEHIDDPVKLIEMMDHVYSYINKNDRCYYINDLSEDKDFTIAINVYSQALTFAYYWKEVGGVREQKYSIDVFHNGYIKLTPAIFKNNSFFCFRKYTPKEKEEEELGEISFDFQIYYDDDLHNLQSFLFPLVNGKIYTNSIKNGQFMVYRHSAFVDNNFMYSATLTQLRGKPALYGFICETYPDCNLDMSKFLEMRERGKIDTIHKINNYFVNKKDLTIIKTKGDDINKSSQSRIQYLTVVICESGKDLPNYGECQYSIEIDNYLDEIQLVPELVHVNSMLFSKNSYRIRIADYINTQYIKIYFTIISGNANLNIYSDSTHQNDISSTFNYRHAHRKEIFEKTGNIQEYYYLEIINDYPAFIEIKYETNFNYKGYIKLNPNELNIEYLNKDGKFRPYSVVNPDYFYPIKNLKNNDFYFSIWTMDCTVVYKYNFKEEKNITIWHHQVLKNDINFGTSYGFELKLDNYFYTPKDENEDCTVLIYTGEQSKNIPLLIVDDMFHPSNLKETYYIYPFTISNDLESIFVQFQFDKNSIAQMIKSPKVKIRYKIDNQDREFEEHYITQDTSFVIKREDIIKYCPYNFYQCSLTIEVEKEDENEIPYIILTNVHSSYDSVEAIRKNRVYSYNLRPKDSRYFYTEIDKDEEGEINFMFNKGNGRIFAKMIRKDKIDENPDWNRRVLLPDANSKDLLYNDYTNNVIKYSAKDFGGCDKGCELYFLIETDQVTQDPALLTHVTFNIDQKWEKNENGVNEFFSLNRYIKGTIEDNRYKYYTITIPLEYKKISVNLYSPSAKAYIKLEKAHYCKKENAIWSVTPSDMFGRVIIRADDPAINKDSLKGVSFSIGVAKIDGITLNQDNSYYYLEVQGLYNNNKDYYYLNSERSVICDTGDDNYCHALFYVNKKYNTGKNLLYAWSLNYYEKVTLYARRFEANEIENRSYKDSIEDKFPSLTMYDHKGEGKYMFVNYPKLIGKDVFVLLAFYTPNKNTKIRLIMSGVPSSKILLPYNTERLIVFNEFTKFYLPYDYKNQKSQMYSLNIRSLKSPHKINIHDTEYELNGKFFAEIESFNYSRSFSLNYTENEDEKDQGILIQYSKIRDDKLFYLEKDLKTEVYLQPSKSFPQYIIIDLTYNKTMKIGASFQNMQYIGQKTTDDIFKISGIIINREILEKRIRDPKTKIEGDIIEANYSIKNNNASMYIYGNQIKNDKEYFLYATIDKAPENKNKYKSVLVQYMPEHKEPKDEKEDSSDEDSDSSNPSGGGILFIESKYVIIFIVCLIVGGIGIAVLIAYICARARKAKNNIIDVDSNNANINININDAINDDPLVPKEG